MIKSVLFDLDDTIFDHHYSLESGLKAVMERYDCLKKYSREEFIDEHLRLLNELHQAQVLKGKLSVEEARVERFKRAFENTGVRMSDEQNREAAEIYRINYESHRRLVDGSQELLQALKKRVKIGIVSNNLLSQQSDKIDHFGLNNLIDVLTVSEIARVTKPDPKIFHSALKELRVDNDESVMIGDSWEEDIIGANNAGIRTIWFNRFNKKAPSNNFAAEINSLKPSENILKLIFQ